MARTRFFRSHLYSSTALGSLILSGSLLFPVHAQEVIGGSDTVVVDGSGDGTTGTQNSPWDINGQLRVGGGVAGDAQLLIENGGTVSNTAGYIGTGSLAESSATVTVTGAGSTWTNSQDLNIADQGDATLTISNGGAVYDRSGFIGLNSGSTGVVTVTGAGSLWDNSFGFRVGYQGNATLTISEGGVVSVGPGEATIAEFASATGTLNIGAAAGEDAAGAGVFDSATLQFGAGTGALVFNHTDTDYTFGAAISGNGEIRHLSGATTLTADSSAFTGETYVNGGTLAITGQLGGALAYIGENAGTSGAVAVAGADASWAIASDLYVGFEGDGALTITTGGSVSNTVGTIGLRPDSTGVVTVTGAGSTWASSEELYVGEQGTGTLTVSDGASVSNRRGHIGYLAGSTGTATVAGAGSSWANSETLYVGDAGSGTLTIAGGGSVSNTTGAIGLAAGATGTVMVTGAGSSWVNGGSLYVGHTGEGTLAISDGGSVSNTVGYIGYGGSAATGAATVTGAGSTWTSSQNLYVGYFGDGALTISDGGVVNAGGTLNIASGIGATGTLNIGAAEGEIAVGAGTLNATSLIFGDGTGALVFNHTDTDYSFDTAISGSGEIRHLSGTTTLAADNTGFAGETYVNGGTLVITGQLGGDFARIGETVGSSGVADVAGADANWALNSDLIVGYLGDGALTVSNGGSVSSAAGFIGMISGSSGVADVTGAGSNWTNDLALFVGFLGDGTLSISDVGSVSNTDGIIGANSGSSGAATVTGPGSSWTNSQDLFVGFEGDGTLTISEGGSVSSAAGSIGVMSGASGAATVTGAGSSWTNSAELVVGDGGSGALTVSNGGAVSNQHSYIGLETGATGTVAVTGAGSTLANSSELAVGYGGNGTLSVSEGGVVSDNVGYVGLNAGATGAATVTGPGSTWTNNVALYVGASGDGTLSISGGGSVTDSTGAIGFNSSATGAAIVTGPGSSWTNSTALFVGYGGDGTLSVSDGGAISSGNTTIGYLSGATGAVSVTGAGTTWTNSAGFFVGYQGDGALTISDDGTVDVDGTMTIARNTGSTGTLNIGAASGSAAVAAGTLSAATVRFGDGTGTINFNHRETDYDFAAVIAGAGTINQIAGVTNLTADSSSFAGTTNVAGGTLSVNNALGGAINMNGGRLGGSGTLGNLTIASGGTLAPGNSIGTLNVASATFNAGSVYEVEVNSAGQSDLIDATGTATINGGIVRVVPFPDFALDTQYTILTAAGGIVGGGTFDNVELNSLFLTPTLAYGANDVFLTIAQTANFADVALTPNQIAAAGGAQSLGGGAVFSSIASLGDADEARAAFDAISGEVHASAKTALIEDSRFAREAAVSRTRAVFDAVASDRSVAERKISDRFAFWGQGFGSWGDWDSDGNAAEMDRSIGGLFLGGDARLDGNVSVGALAGYSHSDIDVDARRSSATADSYYLGLYGGGQWGALGLRAGGAYTWHDVDVSRTAAFTGFSDNLSSSYSAGTGQIFGELGYGMDGGPVRYEPFANLAYVNLSTDGVTENGGAAALTVASDNTDTTFLTLGLRADTAVMLGGSAARLTGALGWRHAFGDIVPTSRMAFASGSDAFTIAGVPIADDALVVDAGIDVTLTPIATLGLSYGGQFGSGLSDQSLKGNLDVKF